MPILGESRSTTVADGPTALPSAVWAWAAAPSATTAKQTPRNRSERFMPSVPNRGGAGRRSKIAAAAIAATKIAATTEVTATAEITTAVTAPAKIAATRVAKIAAATVFVAAAAVTVIGAAGGIRVWGGRRRVIAAAAIPTAAIIGRRRRLTGTAEE